MRTHPPGHTLCAFRFSLIARLHNFALLRGRGDPYVGEIALGRGFRGCFSQSLAILPSRQYCTVSPGVTWKEKEKDTHLCGCWGTGIGSE